VVRQYPSEFTDQLHGPDIGLSSDFGQYDFSALQDAYDRRPANVVGKSNE
jgi:hypothetical protein